MADGKTLDRATLLVVEDEPQIRGFFRRWFEQAGARVLEAEHGLEALELIQREHVDLVVSDVRMPVMDGITLARQISTLSQYWPKILFISGFTDLSDREAYHLGIEAMLAKPIARKALLAAVERCLADKARQWAWVPDAVAQKLLRCRFESRAQAERDGMIAFGRGGLCVRSGLAARTGERIGMQIEFAAEQRALTGHGIVRWAAPAELLLGIEIAAIADADLEWTIDLFEASGSGAYIPRACGGG